MSRESADGEKPSPESVTDVPLITPSIPSKIPGAEAEPRPTTWRQILSRRLTWGPAFWLILLLVFLVAALDRYLEWDEAVFFSQSGGLDGNPSRPNYLSPSREFGPPVLIAALRLLGLDLAQTRMGWAVLAIALSVVAYRSLGHLVGRVTAMTSLLTLWTFWLTLAFSGSFYGSLFAGLFGVLAIAEYLHIRSEPGWRHAILFGIAISGAFAMRQFESAIVTLVIVGHSILIHPTVMWRDRLKESLFAVATFVVAFVVPWVGLTVRQFGSISERFHLLGDQLSGLPTGWTWGADEYINVIAGRTQANTPFTRLPSWPLTGMAIALGSLALLGLVNRRSPQRPSQAVVLIATIGATLVAFFALRYATVEVRDRYVTMIAPFAAVLVGWLWARSIDQQSRPEWLTRLALGTIAIVWLTSQLALAIPYEDNRDRLGEANLLAGSTMRVLAGSDDCVAVSRFGAPEIQAASGCAVGRITQDDAAIDWAVKAQSNNLPAFILWPGPADTLDLPNGWAGLDNPVGTSQRTLYYFTPQS